MVKENMNGRMELTMKEISYKVLGMALASGIKIQTVFMKASLKKTISMEKESNIIKMEVIYKDILLRVEYQKESFIILEDK